MKKRAMFAFIFLLLIFLLLILFINKLSRENQKSVSEREGLFEISAEGLNIPWEIEFLPSGEMLITERPGNLVRIGEERGVIKIEGVEHRGEGGLLGLALHPGFEQNNFIYLYLTSNSEGIIENRVERYKLNLDANTVQDKKVILSGIPGAPNHDGGRIEFGPDGNLYITTGDAGNEDNSQNTKSLAGKILRVDDEGVSVGDNPFGDRVYSYGHRNPQGLAWDSQSRLWSTEHGRSGAQSGFDELNTIEKGNNYGWPIIQGDESIEGMEPPIIHSGSSDTWAPAGAAFYKGNVFFTGLRGETLYQYNIQEKTLKEHFVNQFGRLRAITVYNDSLYISTSNRDGRGSVNSGDDKIIRVNLQKLLR